MKPIKSFLVTANVPTNIAKLTELAYNYWWCWETDAKDLFYRIDREIWQKSNHNPIELLNKLSQVRFQELAEETEFVSYLDFVHNKFLDYMGAKSWFSTKCSNENGLIAYFSTEYGINESFPNYSGGLGILSGDHLKSASDLGLPMIGVGLLYQEGYFRQHLLQNGWQTEHYNFNDFNAMPMLLARDENNKPIHIDVDILGEKLYAQIWIMNVGKIKLYLLDTNIPSNKKNELKEVTYRLYGGTRETRIQQEILLGIGGVRAIAALGYEPSCLHINEGHAAFALIERTKQLMIKHGLNFWTAKQIVQASSLFTTHTPVPAGNESFKLDRMEEYFKDYFHSVGLSKEEFLNLGQQVSFNKEEDFSMTVLGLKMTSYHNGVSKLHGEVSRKMWQKVWQNFPEEEIPIGHVTNGIHTQTWVAREFAELFDKYLTPNWRTETDKSKIWDNVKFIPSEELWREKQRRRVLLILFARNYLKSKQKGLVETGRMSQISDLLNTDALTIGFARRFATYKRAMLIFHDIERLKLILNNEKFPVQIIIAGKAHPHDVQGKEVIQQIIQKIKANGLEKKIIFLEDYDMVIGRMLVKGCDVWLNNPIRPLEASGTSGMKAGLNGTLNFSILDGWWDESFNGSNGFAIGEGEEHEDQDQQWEIDANQAYDALENNIVRLFYNRDGNNIPYEWVAMMKESIRTIAPSYSTTRMLKDYSRNYYGFALKRYNQLSANGAENARNLREWKNYINLNWSQVAISEVETNYKDLEKLQLSTPINISAKIYLGNLHPNDVLVEVIYGCVNHENDLKRTSRQELINSDVIDGKYVYKGTFETKETGRQGYTVRVMPKNDLLESAQELYLCTWA